MSSNCVPRPADKAASGPWLHRHTQMASATHGPSLQLKRRPAAGPSFRRSIAPAREPDPALWRADRPAVYACRPPVRPLSVCHSRSEADTPLSAWDSTGLLTPLTRTAPDAPTPSPPDPAVPTHGSAGSIQWHNPDQIGKLLPRASAFSAGQLGFNHV